MCCLCNVATVSKGAFITVTTVIAIFIPLVVAVREIILMRYDIKEYLLFIIFVTVFCYFGNRFF